MKIDFNRNYTTIALYALVVVLCGILFIFAFANFGAVWTYVVDFLRIFMPIFYGMFIAYLIYPLVKLIRNHFTLRKMHTLNENQALIKD